MSVAFVITGLVFCVACIVVAVQVALGQRAYAFGLIIGIPALAFLIEGLYKLLYLGLYLGLWSLVE